MGDTLYSHQGLTYGGLVMDIDVTAADVIQLFREMNDWLRAAGIRRVVYKPVPWVYHQHAAEEENPFAMIIPLAMGANISGVITSAIAAGVFVTTIGLIG